MKYRISAKASDDIDKIWLYTLNNWSLTQADSYYRLIYQEIKIIAENSNTGKDISNIKSGYRQTKVKSHLIIYRISHDGILEIVRILHKKMDIPNRLR
ncbi:MAG TPA: type II toxin-antitoxin system RelE/ParE family toxin [Chitinophagales bacterium]|nr:type II toxin-antitoxin system RelE/ParE family toxin [Chitinophagales bacterium]